MTEQQMLMNLKSVTDDLSEALEYYKESIKLAELAFSKLINTTIVEDLIPFQKRKSEHYRGLAIKDITLALEGLHKDQLKERLGEASANVDYAIALARGGMKEE